MNKPLRYVLCILICHLIFCSHSIGQKKKIYTGLPDDLNKERIIFLKFDSIQIDESLSRAWKKDYAWRNENASKANKILEEEAKNYPFEYKIASRTEIKDLEHQGYRYVFENDMMAGYNSGDQLFVPFRKYVSAFYVLDLKTGNKYELWTISQNFAYRYDYNIRKLIDKTKKKFKKNLDG